MRAEVTSPGSYKIDGQVNLAEIPLSADVGTYPFRNPRIRLSHGTARRTMPMKNSVRLANSGQPNPKIETFKQSARKDADFMEECLRLPAWKELRRIERSRCRTTGEGARHFYQTLDAHRLPSLDEALDYIRDAGGLIRRESPAGGCTSMTTEFGESPTKASRIRQSSIPPVV